MTTTTSRPFTILLSSAGRRVSLLRSLRQAISDVGIDGRVIACDLGWTAPAMHVADAGFVMPRCTDPQFVDRALELCADEGVDLVVPTIDTELPVWARLRDRLAERGTTVAVSDPAAIDIAADKRLTNRHCRSIGAPCPRQASLSEVQANPADWQLPLIAKPARGSASSGVVCVSDWETLRDIHATEPMVVEEHALGVEHTVDVYVDRTGTVRCPVVRRRLEVRAGEVSKGQVVQDDRLADLALLTVKSLPGAYGPLNVQIFDDGTASTVIEINARFGGGYPLTWQAGGRYGEWLVREQLGHQLTATLIPDYGLMMLRWDEEIFVRA
jgi:carbamoyl-phosphate synthase large subunit